MSKIYFSKEHEWIEVEDDLGTVGITLYAQEQLGDIVFAEVAFAVFFSFGAQRDGWGLLFFFWCTARARDRLRIFLVHSTALFGVLYTGLDELKSRR